MSTPRPSEFASHDRPAAPSAPREDAAAVLPLADARAVRDLEEFATRARRASDTGMRLVVDREAGSAGSRPLAQWVSVLHPAGLGDPTPVVLGLRTVPLAPAADGHGRGAVPPDGLDVVVPLGAVAERTARMRTLEGAQALDFPLPPTRETVTWTALTPPRGGWRARAEVDQDELIELARAGAEAVREALPQEAGEAVVRQVRARMWSPLLGGDVAFPAGMAFGAHVLGFLRPGERARISVSGPWRRLDTPGGFVLARAALGA